MKITSTAFKNGANIPAKYTCEGKDISPPIEIGKIPQDAKSLALVVEDPDAPGKTWIHWVVWNIPVKREIAEGEIPGDQGINDFKRNSYGGPCPPSGTHRYFFKVYALDQLLEIDKGSTLGQVQKAMEGHILGFGELMGLYTRG